MSFNFTFNSSKSSFFLIGMDWIMIIGFAIAAYAIVANDSIQTLGTFIASNSKRPWWALWLWISGLMCVTIIWGWIANGGDPAFGRLSAVGKNIPHPYDYGSVLTWLFIIPPLSLVILTRYGIPVSTSLLVLTGFKGLVAQQQGGTPEAAIDLFSKMMEKSMVGYGIAFVIGILIFFLVLGAFEKRVYSENQNTKDSNDLHPYWIIFQWLSTGFLWSMWLVQDLANIFVYLPRNLSLTALLISLAGMVLLQGYIFRERGGRIQKVVTLKTNTLDVRSATFIDLFYGLVLLFFKVDYIPKLFSAFGMDVPWPEKMPMSTTWVFLGLLAGREIGMALYLRHKRKKEVSSIVFMDLLKVCGGSLIAVFLAFTLPLIANKVISSETQDEQTAITLKVDDVAESEIFISE